MDRGSFRVGFQEGFPEPCLVEMIGIPVIYPHGPMVPFWEWERSLGRCFPSVSKKTLEGPCKVLIKASFGPFGNLSYMLNSAKLLCWCD